MAEGTEVGPYRIVRRLALGERSEVLLARVHGPYGFQRTVVLKRLIGNHARDPLWLRRLAAEAIAYARLSHSAIVRLYDFVELEGTPALVLEYVPGISLESLVRNKRERDESLGDAEILYIGARVFAALAAAHGARHPETGEFSPVIHRDVSPGNVLVSTHGEVKLSDFGIARVAGVTDETPSGTLLGTYGYMAPEQIVGDSITVRADVYGAALLLWELFAGRHAFDRGSLPELEILQAMAQPRIPPIERLRPDLPPGIGHALGRALRAEPDERVSARDMLEVLRVHVRSVAARAALADALGRARRSAATLPEVPVARAWTATDPDPDATGEVVVVMGEQTPEPTTPPRPKVHTETPAALVVSLPVAAPQVRPPAQGRAHPAVAWIAVVAASVAPFLASAGAFRTALSSPAPPLHPAVPGSVTETPTAESPAEPTPSSEPDVEASSGPASPQEPSFPPDVGLLLTPAGMANHRVFVDGVARGSGGQAVRIECGRHGVRLGSAGRFQWVDVPCGGQVRIDR
jgi:serine/threonine-protein kinase